MHAILPSGTGSTESLSAGMDGIEIRIGSGDWAEVRRGDELLYRGHEDEASDYALTILGAKFSYGDVDGPRYRA